MTRPMLIDCADLADGTIIDADICVIGAGPAGLTVASTLAESNQRVVVIEAGYGPGKPIGLEHRAADVTDSDFDAPLAVPHRFGGAANEWIVRLPKMRRGVRMLPLDPQDLAERSWVPNSGWPLDWSELSRWYRDAVNFLGLSPVGFDLAHWADPQHPAIDLDPAGFTTGIEQMADPRLFTRKIYDRLARSVNVDVYLGATAGELDGTADRAVSLTLDHGVSDRLRVHARTFVVACGGMENARILLQARRDAGFGAGTRNVGAYYVDHHRCITGLLTPSDPNFLKRASLYDLTTRRGAHVMGKIVPTAELRREHQLMHSGSMILPKPNDDTTAGLNDLIRFRSDPRNGIDQPSRAIRSGTALARAAMAMALRQRRLPPKTDAGWSGAANGSFFHHFMVETQIELAPTASNRLELGASDGPFGRRRLQMTWRWTDADLQSLHRTTQLLVDAFEQSGTGTFVPIVGEGLATVTTPNGAFHPSGTTRMSASPSTGVVDGKGAVHGTPNLFVAGSSVFPTVGYANPTLTVVALALRLAAHLRDR